MQKELQEAGEQIQTLREERELAKQQREQAKKEQEGTEELLRQATEIHLELPKYEKVEELEKIIQKAGHFAEQIKTQLLEKGKDIKDLEIELEKYRQEQTDQSKTERSDGTAKRSKGSAETIPCGRRSL